MIGKLLPLLSLLAGSVAGVAAGTFLPGTEEPTPAAAPHETGEEKPAESEFVKLNNQFVVPLIRGDEVAALVVLSLGLEVEAGATEEIYQREPRIRDAFLRVLFDQAAMGTFDGAFTQVERLDGLSAALLEEVQGQLGAQVRDVLITDIVRQDV